MSMVRATFGFGVILQNDRRAFPEGDFGPINGHISSGAISRDGEYQILIIRGPNLGVASPQQAALTRSAH